MKLKNTYVLTEIGNDTVAVPVSESAESSRRVIRLNKTAAEIWRGIEQEKSFEEIAAGLVEKYDGVDQASAMEHIKNTVNKLIEAGIVTE